MANCTFITPSGVCSVLVFVAMLDFGLRWMALSHTSGECLFQFDLLVELLLRSSAIDCIIFVNSCTIYLQSVDERIIELIVAFASLAHSTLFQICKQWSRHPVNNVPFLLHFYCERHSIDAMCFQHFSHKCQKCPVSGTTSILHSSTYFYVRFRRRSLSRAPARLYELPRSILLAIRSF